MKAVIKSSKWLKEFETKFGIMHLHKVAYDDKEAFYTSKSKEQNKFVAGQEAEFEEEKKSGKNGDFISIKPLKQAWAGGSGYAKAIKKEQSKYSGFAVSYAKDLVIAGKIELADLPKYTRSMFNLMVDLDKSIQND